MAQVGHARGGRNAHIPWPDDCYVSHGWRRPGLQSASSVSGSVTALVGRWTQRLASQACVSHQMPFHDVASKFTHWSRGDRAMLVSEPTGFRPRGQ